MINSTTKQCELIGKTLKRNVNCLMDALNGNAIEATVKKRYNSCITCWSLIQLRYDDHYTRDVDEVSIEELDKW